MVCRLPNHKCNSLRQIWSHNLFLECAKYFNQTLILSPTSQSALHLTILDLWQKFCAWVVLLVLWRRAPTSTQSNDFSCTIASRGPSSRNKTVSISMSGHDRRQCAKQWSDGIFPQVWGEGCRLRMIRTLLTVSHPLHCAALNPENVGLKGIVCHFVEFVTRLDFLPASISMLRKFLETWRLSEAGSWPSWLEPRQRWPALLESDEKVAEHAFLETCKRLGKDHCGLHLCDWRCYFGILYSWSNWKVCVSLFRWVTE